MATSARYIAVDLDGTLVRGDVFLEACLRLLTDNILNIFLLFAWALRGRSYLKSEVAARRPLDMATLLFEADLIETLKREKSGGAHLILATAADGRHARQVADHLGIFDGVLASDAAVNLKGRHKLAAIKNYVGNEPFIYAGDSVADRPIWEAAGACIFVRGPRKDQKAAEKSGRLMHAFGAPKNQFRAFVRAIRPHQFLKNLLVFAPLLTSHRYLDTNSLVATGLAFVCFSLCAAGVYLLNDLLDLPFDRQHALKQHRPLAAGLVSIPLAAGGAFLLPASAILLAYALLPFVFAVVLAGYFITTLAYSLFLKRVSTVDIMTLAALYSVRVIGGAVALGVGISAWLIAFSVFLFVSLAYLKRYIEVADQAKKTSLIGGRDYSVTDKESLYSLGVANMTAAIVVLTLFINSDEVKAQYTSPGGLWLLCFLMLFWGNRLWMLARRGEVTHDPVVSAVKDPVSLLVGIGLLLTVIVAKYFGF